MSERSDCAKPAWRLARQLQAGAVLVASLTLVSPAGAADLYKVSGVAVDGRGRSAKEAKAAAIVMGERIAVGRLLRRLTDARDHDRLPRPRGKALAALVQGHEVENERAGPRRYRGLLAFIFHPAKVQALLRQANIAFVETGSKPVLVLAVWQDGDRTVLWDDPNPWREAWQHMENPGLLEFLRPSGSLKDIRTVSAKQAVELDRRALTAIAGEYGASTIVIAFGAVKGAAADILVRRYNTVTGKPRVVGRYRSPTGAEALRKTAAKIAADYEAAWKRANIVPAGATSTITVRAPLQSYAYWSRLRDGLRQVRLIRQRRLISLTPRMAVIELGYAGGVPQLTEALRQNDIELRKGGAEGDTEVWEVYLIGARTVMPADRQPPAAPAKKDGQ
jgi:hypothetical protein